MKYLYTDLMLLTHIVLLNQAEVPVQKITVSRVINPYSVSKTAKLLTQEDFAIPLLTHIVSPKQRCVYCGATNVPLLLTHIVSPKRQRNRRNYKDFEKLLLTHIVKSKTL